MRITRLYSDQSGESHFEELEIALQLRDDSPPAKPHYFSEPQSAQSFVMVQCPVGWGGELHPAPRRQIVVCIDGTMTVESSLGDSRKIAPGCCVLLEDTIGKGHISRVTSHIPFFGIIIRLG
jgi:quercetin dioxygenase-like cupin family protein